MLSSTPIPSMHRVLLLLVLFKATDHEAQSDEYNSNNNNIVSSNVLYCIQNPNTIPRADQL